MFAISSINLPILIGHISGCFQEGPRVICTIVRLARGGFTDLMIKRTANVIPFPRYQRLSIFSNEVKSLIIKCD